MAEASDANDLMQVVVLLTAGVVAVPLFKRIGLGSVLGYLIAGLVIGPFGLRFFTEPQAILHVAELGVVMFLFIIGLEMQPSKLWSMRKDIFGLGAAQVLACIAGLTGVGLELGFAPIPSFIAGTGFVLTSTAIVMQMLQERNEISTLKGQRMIAILLFEDLAIVPLLVLVTLLGSSGAASEPSERWMAIGIAFAALVADSRSLPVEPAVPAVGSRGRTRGG